MNKQQVQNRRKRRLIFTMCSMLICFLMIGVTVYAAMAQSAYVVNTVQITGSTGDAVRAQIDVYTAIGPVAADADSATLFAGTSATETGIADWGTATLSKAHNENTKSNSAGTDFHFSKDDKYTYYGYKVVVDNKLNSIASDVSIGMYTTGTLETRYAFDGQISLFTSVDGEAFVAWDNTADAVLATDLAPGASATVYVIVAVNTDLYDLTDVAQASYAFNVNVA